MKLSQCTLILGAGLLSACPPAVTPPLELQINGRVVDVRGGGVEGVSVHIWNQLESKTGLTDGQGRFTLTMKGGLSSIEMRSAEYRPFIGSILLDAAHQELGDYPIVSKEEILFSTLLGDIYMLRADKPASLMQITNTPHDLEITPCRSESGLTMRWANINEGSVYEASWDGSRAHPIYSVGDDYSLLGISCGERGTFVSRAKLGSEELSIIIAEDPPGLTFSYEWPGILPDVSPELDGLYRTGGSLLAFAGVVENFEGTGKARYGLFTAFPYVNDRLFLPKYINGTSANDFYPSWSSLREDGSLDLLFGRSSNLYISHVTIDGTQSYSEPELLYGDNPNAVNANRSAWSLSEPGAPDRIAFVVNVFSSGSTLAERGDIVVMEYDPKSGRIGQPTVIYDADSEPGVALSIDWR